MSPPTLLNLFKGDHGAPPDVLVLLLTRVVDEDAAAIIYIGAAFT